VTIDEGRFTLGARAIFRPRVVFITRPNMAELDDAIHEKIKTLCADGDELAENEDYVEAERAYLAAWDLLPEPQHDWEAATWILAALGDSQYLRGDFDAATETLQAAMHCPGAIGNPFLHMRLGECQFERGNLTRAEDELARAFLLEGSAIFDDEDPKYLTFVKSKLKPPAGGWE